MPCMAIVNMMKSAESNEDRFDYNDDRFSYNEDYGSLGASLSPGKEVTIV